MDTEARLWKLLPIIVAFITCAAPIFVAYDLHNRGSIQASPERCLELSKYIAINPLSDLSVGGRNVSLAISMSGQTLNNLVIQNFTLRNIGKVPIVPADYYEPISVRIERPWRIVAVEPFFKDSILEWRRINDQHFEAKPALINPGDIIMQKVYLTDTKYKPSREIEILPKVDVEVKARITNMQHFTTPRSSADELKSKLPVGFTVYLDGPAVLFTVLSAAIFLLWYLLLIKKIGLLAPFSWKSYLIVIGLAVLSFSVAEIIAYYIFGGIWSILMLSSLLRPSPLDWKTEWHNWFTLILHISISIYLYRRSRVTIVSSERA